MASPRSDEAVNGSVGSGSDSKHAPDPSYAIAQVDRYCQDTTMPVNTLGLAYSSQAGLSRKRDHSSILDSVGNLPHGQQPANGAAIAAPASGMLRGVGAQFDNPSTASTRQGPGSSP
ncbi:uncharacterized protein GGS22DRAFT_186891 [Annulohypoxylon maeteangense]|uniref:uncharacterized protein n=1 Tax=Annulohypoxylon maeteangense TaxID=1927788 RepID=UPI0020077BA9|nr:uncharacterized protein GGS22DRAFT_186891 [Annulohypoxylon maeteangense]KAI0886818.1 hypothetical protein GGS22DRAFT_186891 [Annulohypoxylon maeteangense]